MGDVAVTMTALRQKLIDEIQLRGFSIHTQDSYVRSVTGLARFYHRSPDQIVDDEIKAYLLHLLRIKKLAVSSIIVAVSALRFFFGQCSTARRKPSSSPAENEETRPASQAVQRAGVGTSLWVPGSQSQTPRPVHDHVCRRSARQ